MTVITAVLGVILGFVLGIQTELPGVITITFITFALYAYWIKEEHFRWYEGAPQLISFLAMLWLVHFRIIDPAWF